MGLLFAELSKLRRSFIPFAVLSGGILPAITNMLMQSMDSSFSWPVYTTKWLLFLNLSCMLTLSPMAGFLFTNEYEHRTMDNIFSSPVQRLKIFGAKLCVFIILEIFCFAVSFLTMILWGAGSGVGFPADPGIWELFAKGMAGVFVIHAACAPASLLAGLLGKRTLLPIVLGLVHLALYRVFVFSDIGMFIPSSMPAPWVISVTGQNIYGVTFTLNPMGSAISLALFAAIPLLVSAIVFAKRPN